MNLAFGITSFGIVVLYHGTDGDTVVLYLGADGDTVYFCANMFYFLAFTAI